ncbi:MAG TPA: SelB C-terminal domain-containing protein, partial [Fimbriimonadaceae bacterium]|nr:SelB C-terminal domain-containing protein [Fimbriimonadaceae bacterium]
VGSEEGIGRLFLSDREPDVAQVRLEAPLACALRQPVILRRYSPPDLLGGGRIVVPQASPRRKGEEISLVEEEQDDAGAIQKVLQGKLNGVPTEEVCRALGKSAQALGPVFEGMLGRGEALGFAGLWFTPEDFAVGADRLVAALSRLHEEHPTQSTQPRERALQAAGLKWSGKPLDRIVAHLVTSGVLAASGTAVRLPGFSLQLTPRQRSFLDRVISSLQRAGVNVPSAHDLAQELGVPHQATAEILRLGVESGELVRIDEGIYYTKSQLEDLKEQIRRVSAGKPFAASEFRDAVGTTRKYAIPLLEYLDGVGFTMRLGDKRVVRSG